MKMRRKPAVLRFHKYNAERDPDAYWYSEALLYLSHRDETDLQNKIAKAKADVNGAWDSFVNRISHVKAQVMEYIEDNEEARLQAAEMFIDNALTGELMPGKLVCVGNTCCVGQNVMCDNANMIY